MAIKTVRNKMTYKVQIDDLVRDATADEIVQLEADQANYEAQKATEQAEAEARKAAKAAAQAKLAALGLTVEDLQALGL
jgi:hypothetical protein